MVDTPTPTPSPSRAREKGIYAERKDLLTLRNDLIQRELSNILLAYLQDYVTEQAVKNLDATEIEFYSFKVFSSIHFRYSSLP